MKQKTTRLIIRLSNIGYIFACIVLYLIAICILISSIWQIVLDMQLKTFTVYNLLDEVGLIVFSMAVIDVGKYLMLEEVIRRSIERHGAPHQSRKTLTKFAIIIASALSLEGLVLTIEVAKQDVTNILYPVSLLITSAIYIIGIGVYQKFNADSERK